MNKVNVLIAASGFSALISSSYVLAEAGYSFKADGSKPADVTADVKFVIKIPSLMILQVGDFGNTENIITWNLDPTTAPAFAASDNADYAGNGVNFLPTLTASGKKTADKDDGNTANDGKLSVGVWGNVGTITLASATLANFTAGANGAQAPVVADISALDGGTVTHPTFDGAATTLAATNGVVSKTDEWTYQYDYDPAAVSAGEWTGAEVQYTISAP